jgi:uncharacterized protein YjiS (DUF1127 family)
MLTKLVTANKLAPYCDRYKWNIHLFLSTLLFRIKKWRRNAITRKELAGLDPFFYQDIGVTDQQVLHEVHKNFWQ